MTTLPSRALSWGAYVCVFALGSSLLGCACSRTVEREVNKWVVCLECTDGEVSRLRRFGERALPALIQIIVAPRSAADEQFAREQLRERYRKLASYSKGPHEKALF